MLTTNAKIQAYRHQAGMTQGDVADKLQMSRVGYHNKESGKAQWRLDELMSLAELFGVSVRDILGDEG
jgi:DNA-binding XRE family transcriptional regulator